MLNKAQTSKLLALGRKVYNYRDQYEREFSFRDIQIMSFRTGMSDGNVKSVEEVANKFGLSTSRVLQIQDKFAKFKPKAKKSEKTMQAVGKIEDGKMIIKTSDDPTPREVPIKPVVQKGERFGFTPASFPEEASTITLYLGENMKEEVIPDHVPVTTVCKNISNGEASKVLMQTARALGHDKWREVVRETGTILKKAEKYAFWAMLLSVSALGFNLYNIFFADNVTVYHIATVVISFLSALYCMVKASTNSNKARGMITVQRALTGE